MVGLERTESLNNAVRSLGFSDVDTFARTHAVRMLEGKILYYQSRVDFYERKYGMSYDVFVSRVVDRDDPVLSKFGIIEKEDDDNDWEDSLHFVQSYSERLRALEP